MAKANQHFETWPSYRYGYRIEMFKFNFNLHTRLAHFGVRSYDSLLSIFSAQTTRTRDDALIIRNNMKINVCIILAKAIKNSVYLFLFYFLN